MSDPKPMNIDPTAKLKILGLEESRKSITVTAQFNPKELQVDKAVPWQKQKKAKDSADLEFTGAEPMSMAVELLFDGYDEARSVMDQVKQVHDLAEPEPKLKRPSKVKIIWGENKETKEFPEFTGVIESVATKYTMFAPDGTILRATVNIKFKQANNIKDGVAKKG